MNEYNFGEISSFPADRLQRIVQELSQTDINYTTNFGKLTVFYETEGEFTQAQEIIYSTR